MTGKVHTHDHELMKKINDERGYLNDVIKFNEKVRKKGLRLKKKVCAYV